MLQVQLRQHARRRGEDQREADAVGRAGRSPLTSAEPTAPTTGRATRSSRQPLDDEEQEQTHADETVLADSRHKARWSPSRGHPVQGQAHAEHHELGIAGSDRAAAHSGISVCFTFGCNSTQEAAAKISTKPMMSAVVNRSPR